MRAVDVAGNPALDLCACFNVQWLHGCSSAPRTRAVHMSRDEEVLSVTTQVVSNTRETRHITCQD